MAPDALLPTLLAKARAVGGPFLGLVFLAAAGGWALRGNVAGADTLRAQVARLDSVTVKQDDFRALQRDVRETRILAESTQTLVRRLICRQFPRDNFCP